MEDIALFFHLLEELDATEASPIVKKSSKSSSFPPRYEAHHHLLLHEVGMSVAALDPRAGLDTLAQEGLFRAHDAKVIQGMSCQRVRTGVRSVA